MAVKAIGKLARISRILGQAIVRKVIGAIVAIGAAKEAMLKETAMQAIQFIMEEVDQDRTIEDTRASLVLVPILEDIIIASPRRAQEALIVDQVLAQSRSRKRGQDQEISRKVQNHEARGASQRATKNRSIEQRNLPVTSLSLPETVFLKMASLNLLTKNLQKLLIKFLSQT